MIKTYKQLKETLKIERSKYFGENLKINIEKILVNDKDVQIFKYQRNLRRSEFYYNNKDKFICKLLYLYYRRKKNILGNKLGIEIWENTFDVGLKIWHAGSIIVNGDSKVGKNCELKGEICIGNNGFSNLSPKLGNNVSIGNGAKIIGGITLGNNIIIGAGAVVTKSFDEDDIVLVGIPAKKVYKE